MTIDAIHTALRGLLYLIGLERIFHRVNRDMSFPVFRLHPWDHLPLVVGRNIRNLIPDIHVPVNAGRQTGGRIAATRLHQHADLPRRVFLVGAEMREHPQLIAMELVRPVTLLTSLRRRAQIGYRRWNRSRIFMERHRIHLVCARQLGLHIPAGARAHVTVDTGYACMRRLQVRCIFRLHHRVAQLTAELNRVREFVGAIAARSTERDENNNERRNRCQRAPLLRIVQIDARKTRDRRGGTRTTPAPLNQHSQRDQQQAEPHDPRHDHVAKDADVWVRPVRQKIDKYKKSYVRSPDDSDDGARQAHQVADQTWCFAGCGLVH